MINRLLFTFACGAIVSRNVLYAAVAWGASRNAIHAFYSALCGKHSLCVAYYFCLYLFACQVRVTVGDIRLCRVVTSFERYYISLFVECCTIFIFILLLPTHKICFQTLAWLNIGYDGNKGNICCYFRTVRHGSKSINRLKTSTMFGIWRRCGTFSSWSPTLWTMLTQARSISSSPGWKESTYSYGTHRYI